ncbi:FkbM family methyltransferase [Chryseobacterium populi]|uniref:Methyltransferase, FkbM family n=1 Tax=Chryseobacterium populi TaxID=1144316 RepID=J3CBQ4_9FLAO|nr:FkbM family methyltransferase [Chryseobacterium populi]EJL68379.1 methyltransferase, FkbM family [Chryseobacterium populi]
MSLKNYISKLSFSSKISSNLTTFTAFIVNTKRYSSKFKKNRLDFSNTETFVYRFRKAKRNFDIYLRTFKGDIDIFYEIFWKKTYDKHLKLLKKNPEVIVDFGAHIGLTSIYFALKYPNAKIYSVEASPENFQLLKANTASFKNIACFHAAAHFEDGSVNFGTQELSYNQKVSESGIPVQALSVETFMKNNHLQRMDLLKIDIEGAEADLLSKNNSWLQHIENIIIEIHSPYDSKNLSRDLEPFQLKIKQKEGDVLFADKE